MRWVLRLIATEGDARCLSTDLIEICRPEGLGDIADLGLTLPEAKQLLASVQRAVIAAQADSHRLQRPCCSACSGKCHLKDWRSHRIATPFGAVTVPLPSSGQWCHRSLVASWLAQSLGIEVPKLGFEGAAEHPLRQPAPGATLFP